MRVKAEESQMCPSLIDGRMEGWLYVIRSNRIGLQHSKKRYFILEDDHLDSFRSMPASSTEDPATSALIDSRVWITDGGKVSIGRKVLFVFTLHNALKRCDRLKLGARSAEEAARWTHSFKQAAAKGCLDHASNVFTCNKRKCSSFRFHNRESHYRNSIDWTLQSASSVRITSDVVAPSPWKIFGCQNGLRLFKEAKDRTSCGKQWDDHSAIMAVGVVDASSEIIFETLMSLGSSRAEWDFCFSNGYVVEQLDDHTDIIYEQLSSDWLPWGMKGRDFLLRRYWRREDDGTYVILHHSVFHMKCLPKRGFVRACLKSGGFIVSPVNQGKQSVVKHMLAIDWKFWKSYLFTSSGRSITIQMLERVAALRELFRARAGSCRYSEELTKEIRLMQTEEDIKVELQSQGSKRNEAVTDEEGRKTPARLSARSASFLQLNDATDEFFDVSEGSDYEMPENIWLSDIGMEMHSQVQDLCYGRLSSAAGFVKKLQGLSAQKRGYMDLQNEPEESSKHCNFGSTLPEDQAYLLACSWAEADPTTFLIRGENFLHDRQKIKAKDMLMKMVGADWLKSDKREDDIAGRPGSIVQRCAEEGEKKFFFVVNIQVPGSTTYNLVLYYMLDYPVESIPLLDGFVKGDDAYRNSRFKLIPYISKGSWIVKQSVGKKACLVGQALQINYFQGKNYIELGIDVGSSTVARGVVSLVLGYLNNLVIEMAFLIQANTEEELPEALLGTCRFNHLDASKAVLVD